MNRSLHICIHGAGGLGSLIGGYLANAGIDTTQIARPAHVERIAASGLQISGTRGDIIVREHRTAVTHPAQVDRDIDYYILLTKVKDAASALSDAASIADRIDCALSLQKWIASVPGKLSADRLSTPPPNTASRSRQPSRPTGS